MSQTKNTLNEALRAFLRTGQNDAPKVLPELMARAWALLSQGAKPGESAALSGECVFLLAAILRNQRDQALAVRLLQTLASTGRLGRALVCLHVQSRTLPLPQLSPLLQALPGRDFLALLNDLLLESPADDKQLAAWLKTLLPAPGRLDIREALIFLKTLAVEGLSVARPLRNALLAGGLAEGLSRALAGTPGAATAEALLQAVDVLGTPALQTEALAYALRTAGAEGPSRLGPLLAAPPDLEPRDSALVTEMRRLILSPDGHGALQAAAQTEPETLGLVVANLLQSGGEHAKAALRIIPLLPHRGVQSCLNDLPENARSAVFTCLLHSVLALHPGFLRRAAKYLGPSSGLDGPSAQALADLLAGAKVAQSNPALANSLDTSAWKGQPAMPVGPAPTLPKSAQNRRPPLSEAVQDAHAPIKDQDFSHSTLVDSVMEGLTFSSTDLSRCRFSSVTFRRVRLSATQLAGCAFESCVFQDCAFVATDCSFSQFNACHFVSCTFEYCDLSGIRISASDLSGCSFTESSLAGAKLGKSRLQSTSLRTCTLAGALLHECALARLTFLRTDLTGCLWEHCVVRQAEMLACSFTGAHILSSECLDLRLARAATAGFTVIGGHTNNPHLAKAERATQARRLDPGQACPPLAPALQTAGGAAFVRTCIHRFLRVDEAKRTLSAMRSQNQRRNELALERLTEAQGHLFKLLPTLLATDVFELAHAIAGVPACAVEGHPLSGALSKETSAQLERFFPGQAPTRKPTALFSMEAVYAIGSLGSVAQKPSSDVDCWVCFRPVAPLRPEALAEARAGLSRKLAALEAWAWQQFELEVHFFLMAMEDVRQNNFGMSDKESSGTAQAALLKEEFYRTALKLAGRDLLWWAVPPTATQAQAEELLADLTLLAPRTAAELVDLGQPMPIPPGEYFGACLWQIVKALHSPYKSVMKLGLLEKYADQGQDMRLLCDRIKEAVLRGRKLAEDVDPYLSLFTSIRKHYRGLADTTSLTLISECLRLKANVAPEDLPPEFDTGTGAKREPQSEAGDLAHAPGHEQGTFAAALRLGGMVNLFMISAYRRIQEGIRADRNAAQISPEDLTRLGRRIAANFAQHPSKVGLVPFLSEDMTFTELYFYAEKAPGKRTIWAVKGKTKASGKAAVESLAPIRRDTDVVRLLAWLLFNGLYDHKQALLAEKTLAPIAVMDMQALLADLADFFPRRATLEPDLDEYLRPERVVRAYLIANLPVPPDKNKVHALSAIYATNWGEVFCQSFDNPPLSPQKSTLGYLREVLEKPILQTFPMRLFTPKKSACPKIRLD